MPNSLADALSPYLRQHAGNPVNWQQWGVAPFEEAAVRDVPVFVSIGYSTCHWCHVMARESFSDPDVAVLLNENFVAIKVDREEHPEVDAGYMSAASAFTQNLGWPLNVFVTPAGHAFFAGTYWPPEAVGGHPSFRQVLTAITDAWVNRRDQVEANAEDVAQALRSHALAPKAGVDATSLPNREGLTGAVDALAGLEDSEFGGFGAAPKFPTAPVISFLLEHGSKDSLALADRTLTTMANSGLRDPVEGGFFRYATRRDWSEPHYERMLYDNAQLLDCYSALAIRVPERAELARATAEGIVHFLLEVMRLPGGGFASAQNSESVIDGVLTEGGYYSLTANERAAHSAPALDDKVLTGWNGLTIGAIATAGHRLGRPDWVDAARTSAEHILSSQMQDSGMLARATLDGKYSSARATLEDYGLLARGLLSLAQATGDVRWAKEARALVEACMASDGFAIPGGGDPVLAGFGIDADVDPSEGALPSGQSALADSCRELYLLTGDRRFLDRATETLHHVAEAALRQPLGFGSALAVITALATPPAQLVVVSDDPDAELAVAARSWWATGGVAVTVTEAGSTAWAAAGFELFDSRSLQDGKPTAYLCSDFVCRLPVTAIADFLSLRVHAEP